MLQCDVIDSPTGLQVIADSIAKDVVGIHVKDCTVNVGEWQRPLSAADGTSDLALHDVADACDDPSRHVCSPRAVGFSFGGPGGKVRGSMSSCVIQGCQIGVLSQDQCAVSIALSIVGGCADAGIVAQDGSRAAAFQSATYSAAALAQCCREFQAGLCPA